MTWLEFISRLFFSSPQTDSAFLLKSGNSFWIKTPFVINLQSLKCYPTLLIKLQDKASLILLISSRLCQHFLSDFAELYRPVKFPNKLQFLSDFAGQLTWPDRPNPKSSSSNAKKFSGVVKQLLQYFLHMSWDRGTQLPLAMLKVLLMKSRITVKLIVSWNNMATNGFNFLLRLPAPCHLANQMRRHEYLFF